MIYKNGYLVKALYKGASPVKNVFKGVNMVFGDNGGGCDDTLSFKFDGTVNFKINNTTYTATESPYTTTLGELGISSFVNAKQMFNGYNSYFTEISKIPCTDNVTNMNGMFRVCSGLTSLDVSSLNTSNVVDMSGMFYMCSNLTSLDLNNFNTEKVTTMYGMFQFSSNLTNINLSGFNTEKVTDMSDMFNYCSSLTSLDLNNFNTEKVTSLYNMFCYCTELTMLNVSGWDISKITTNDYMFFGCSKLNRLILGDVTQAQYDWWYQRLVDARIQNKVTIEYNLI